MTTTWRDRLRYAVDEFFARGTVALIAGLFVASALIVIVIAVVITAFNIGPDGTDLVQLLWMGLLRTLDPGTMGSDAGSAPFLAAMLAVTLVGIFVLSALIGIINTGIQGRLSELRKGRSRVLESGHTVILGWSQQVFTILSELVVANANQPRSTIVVLADRDKVEMEDQIRARLADRGRTKIVCRSGSPVDVDEIDVASVQASKAVIVLSPDSDEPDVEVIKTILAITNDPNRRPEPYHIVAEIRDPGNLEAARLVGRDEVELVVVSEIVSRIVAQTCRQAGLSIVYAELLDFAGDEMYFAAEPALEGRTFAQAMQAYEDSTVIGLAPAGGAPHLNPPLSAVIGPGDRLIVISADDDTIHMRAGAPPPIDDEAILEPAATVARPEATLVLGWNRRAPDIARELDAYVPPKSRLTIVTDDPAAPSAAKALASSLGNQKLQFIAQPTTDRASLDGLKVADYDHVIVLSPIDRLDAQRADARTLVTLLHLRDMASRAGHPFSIVSEMADVRNRALAEVTRADDFIVSDRLISLLLAQIAENKALNAVFADLFDAAGSEIYLRPAAEYIRPGRAVNFATVVEAAARRDEVAIGYRLRAHSGDSSRSYGVRVNPRKSDNITFGEGDRVIVLAEG